MGRLLAEKAPDGGRREIRGTNETVMIMKKILLLALLLGCVALRAQEKRGADGSADYVELTDSRPFDGPEAWARMKEPAALRWGSVDVRYGKRDLPKAGLQQRLRLRAWRGERVHAQAVLWSKEALEGVTVEAGDLKGGKAGRGVIPSAAVGTSFVRYVMTDELNKDRKGGCGHRPDKTQWDSLVVADVLDIAPRRDVEARTTQPVWVKIAVPQTAAAGRYAGEVTVRAEGRKPLKLPLELEVVDRVLPDASQWRFHLDLWQNPYAVARYYGVELWSEAHFEAMRPIMKLLCDAGQRSVTATIMHRPWNGQTEDHYDSMIGKTRRIDGSWSYDYTVFDRWVTFMMEEIGIDGAISCYTMIPWALRFDYYDQATARVQFVEARPGDRAYADYWGAFLKDFARHLKAKGWFDITAISMDERSLGDMQAAIQVILEADPDFKITLAGNYHPEIESKLYYLSIPYGQKFPADVKAERERRGQISTVYTCCSEAFPNMFTFSAPAEAVWTAVHALAGGYDGYLRWAVNSWPKDPLRDSRFRSWAAGDTYSIYPGPRSSIRFERLVEGIQACEKIRILRTELQGAELAALEEAVARFTPEGMAASGLSAAEAVGALEAVLNR